MSEAEPFLTSRTSRTPEKGGAAAAAEAHRRDLARQRTAAHRDRKRRGAVLVMIELDPRDLAALERLALLDPGDRDPYRMACAAAQFLAAAPHVAAMGDALWPETAERATSRD